MSFTGRYPGSCGECGEETKDTEVVYDGTNTIVHVICPDTVPTKAREICPRCFMEKPATGRCDCED
jgi:hypothetical protein